MINVTKLLCVVPGQSYSHGGSALFCKPSPFHHQRCELFQGSGFLRQLQCKCELGDSHVHSVTVMSTWRCNMYWAGMHLCRVEMIQYIPNMYWAGMHQACRVEMIQYIPLLHPKGVRGVANLLMWKKGP